MGLECRVTYFLHGYLGQIIHVGGEFFCPCVYLFLLRAVLHVMYTITHIKSQDI